MNTYCIMTIVLSLIQSSGASESWIVGGKVAKPHSKPYMVSLQFYGWDAKWHHGCGGFLIRNDFVLTAAHCRLREMPMTVVLGAHNLREEEPSQQRIHIQEYFQHPNYKGLFDFDIMLLKLKQKAKLNKFVEVTDLPTKDKKISALKCTLPGWGRTEPSKNSPGSDVLKEAVETIQSNDKCKNIIKEYFIPEHMICTKFNKKSGSLCQGDSGGPLICKGKPLGIVAFTDPNDCSNPKYPHGFTKISSFLPWIKKVMGGLGNVSEPSTLDQQINIRFN